MTSFGPSFQGDAPDSAWLSWQRAVALLDLGRPKEAAAEVSRALARFPEDASLWRLLSQLSTDLGDFPQALGAARRAVALEPESSGGHVILGFALWNTQVRGKASGRLRRWPGAWRVAQPALDAMQQALRLEPESEQAQLALAQLYLLMNQPRRATPLIEAVLRASPQQQTAQLYAADAQLQLGQLGAAEAQVRAVLASDPQCKAALQLLSRVSLRRGQAEDAFAAALSAIRLDPADAGAQAHFRALVHEYLPLPLAWQSPAWRVMIVPHAVVLVPLVALGVWVRTLYRVRRLSPSTRAQIRRVRDTSIHWRSPFGLYLTLCLVVFALVFAVPHLPVSLRSGANEALGGLILAVFAGGLLWLSFSGVRSVARWLRSYRGQR